MRLYSNPHRLLSIPMITSWVGYAHIYPDEKHAPGLDHSTMHGYTYVTVTDYSSRISLGFFHPKYVPPKDFILMDVHCGSTAMFEELVR